MEYYVQIIDSDTNEIIEEYSVEEGGYIELPEAPEGYEYASWSDYDSYVYEDTKIYVELRKLTFTAYVYGDVNGYIGEYEVEYGDDFYPELPPDIEGYEFVEYQWNDGSSSDYFPYVTEDIYLTLHYEKLYYHVTFYDTVDGSEFDYAEVAYGEDAYLPDPPWHDGYEFSYWSSDGCYITEDTTIEAYYEPVEYIVEFYAVDDNYNELQWIDTQHYHYDDYVYCPSEPDIEGYEFGYWENADYAITEDTYIYAVYYKKQYEVTFVDGYEDYSFDTEWIYHGEDIEYWPDPPEHEWYKFIGWDSDGKSITEDTTIIAQYEASPYYHRFFIYDVETGEQELLYTLEITEDNQYDVEPPEIPESGDGVYYSSEWLDYDSFSSWSIGCYDKDYHIVKKTSDIEYVPVSFFNYTAWEELGFIYVPYGTILTDFPEFDVEEGLVLERHSEVTEPITNHITVYYYYNRFYKVTFVDGLDGSVVSSCMAPSRSIIREIPEADAHDGYIFCYWDMAGNIATGNYIYEDITITAKYKLKKEYIVKFYAYLSDKNESRLIAMDTYNKNETLVKPGISYNLVEGYNYAGWHECDSKVIRDVDVYAYFNPVYNGPTPVYDPHTWHTLRYVTNDVPGIYELGFVRKMYNDDMVYPYYDVEGYEYTGWEGTNFTTVRFDATFTYHYKKLPTYTVRYLDWDDSIISTQEVIEGKDAVPPEEPTREGYTFNRWSEEGRKIYAALDIRAIYYEGSSSSTFTVTFVDYDGRELSSQTVAKSGSATAPADPVREGYRFGGWDKPFTNIRENTVITATYIARDDKFTVKFIDWNNKLLSEQIITYGKSAIAPATEQREGYVFSGWSRDFSYVTNDLVVYAVYKNAMTREEIEVYDEDSCIGKISMAIKCTIRQALNGECTISLQTLAKYSAIIQPGYYLRYRDLLFNITKISKQTQNGLYVVTVEGEHLSYSLNEFTVDEFYFTGTPADCLNRLLAGSGLVAGNCDFTDEITLNINKVGTTMRAVLTQLIAITGGELEYSYNTIGISSHIGATKRIELLDTLNVTDLGMEYSAAEGTSYDISLSRRTGINLGDEIHISFSQFSIDTNERIYSIEYNPFNFREVKVTIGDYVEEYNEDLYKAVDDMQGKLDELKDDLEKTKKKVNSINWTFPDDDSDGDEITRVLSVDGIPSGDAVDKHTLYLIRGEATFR